MAVNVTLFKKLPYDPAVDFTPLALAAATPFVLVVNPQLPVKNVREFIAYAKAQPQPLNYATSGPGVPHHLFMELLKSMTGLQMTAVPYKGSLPALNDVVAGHVPTMFVDLGPALGQVQGGGVRALGVSMATRVAAIADVPPINDSLPGFNVSSWQMFAAPSGTPRPVAEKLRAEIAGVLASPEVRAQITKAGMLPMDSGSIAQLESFVRAEIKRWGDVVRKAGIEGSM
jgi:tripartite-type tricarboxylate transporter receptor subunit TctC